MSRYYAVAHKGTKKKFVAGPFATHWEALDAADDARHYFSGKFGAFDIDGFGTAREDGERVDRGALYNEALGYEANSFGLYHTDGRRAARRFAANEACRNWKAIEAAFRASKKTCGWCGSEVPDDRVNLNPSMASTCDNDCHRQYIGL